MGKRHAEITIMREPTFTGINAAEALTGAAGKMKYCSD